LKDQKQSAVLMMPALCILICRTSFTFWMQIGDSAKRLQASSLLGALRLQATQGVEVAPFTNIIDQLASVSVNL
jgi:hypothetical protein